MRAARAQSLRMASHARSIKMLATCLASAGHAEAVRSASRNAIEAALFIAYRRHVFKKSAHERLRRLVATKVPICASGIINNHHREKYRGNRGRLLKRRAPSTHRDNIIAR